MTASLWAIGSSVTGGVASASQFNLTVGVPAGTTPGLDRLFVAFSIRGGNVLAPAGWRLVYLSPYPGIGAQGVATGARMHAVYYRDFATGWSVNDLTFIISADFNGQTAAVATPIVYRKASTEDWQEPYIVAGRDTVANTALSASLPAIPVRPSSRGFALVTTPTAVALTNPALTSGGNAVPTSLAVNMSTTLGDDVGQIISTLSPSTALWGAVVHTGTLGASYTAEVAIVLQDVIDPVDKPRVERVPEYEVKFDPRQGGTGLWTGGDVARDIPIPGTNQVLWIFADSFWRSSASGPATTRVPWTFTHSALAIQDGPDLASANVAFYRAPGNAEWFPVDANYYTWPQDAIFIGNDLYVFGQRVSAANPLGAEYGWTIHRIPNAKTTPITSWPVATLLYQSGDTPVRPLWSPYDGGDGYIYVFGVSRTNRTGSDGTTVYPAGWRWARWPVGYLTGTQQNLVEWWTGSGWTYGDNNGMSIADNILTSEGSAHRRASDGRWIITEGVGTDDAQDLAMRLTQSKDANGNYIGWGFSGYLPPPPTFQPGDFAKHTGNGNNEVKILNINGDGSRWVRYTLNNTYDLVAPQFLAPIYKSDRYVYRNPRGVTDPVAAYNNYALKAHPAMPDSRGLIATFVDNGSSAQLDSDVSIYWPKFIRVLPPLISNFAYNRGTGVTSWTVTGAPDRQFYRVNGGAWTEIDPLLRTVTVAANSYVEVMARGLGGDAVVHSNPVSSLRVEGSLVADLLVGTLPAQRAYVGTTRL